MVPAHQDVALRPISISVNCAVFTPARQLPRPDSLPSRSVSLLIQCIYSVRYPLPCARCSRFLYANEKARAVLYSRPAASKASWKAHYPVNLQQASASSLPPCKECGDGY